MNTQKFFITGMSCQNCVTKIKNRLSEHPDIQIAEITLDPPEAHITSNKILSDKEVEEWLKPLNLYRVSSTGPIPSTQTATLGSHDSTSDGTIGLPKDVTTYWPLIILVAYLLMSSYAGASSEELFRWNTVMRLFMGGFFVSFSFFKMLDLKGFADAYRGYDLVAKAFPAYGYIYPFIELTLGLAYLGNIQPILTNLLTVLLMAISLVGVWQAVFSKKFIKCACLGAVFNLPMSSVTIVENLSMLIMALIALIGY